MRALVVGAGSVGEATAKALEARGATVSGAGSERDATDPAQVTKLLDEADPDLIVVTAGARPRMVSVEEHTWESFSTPWNVDVRIAFEVGRAALARPLRPGSTVLVVSSGAGLDGSPLSGGYAGAKRMQMFLVTYLQQISAARGLGIRFVSVAPRQFLVGTAIGEAAATAYGAGSGLPVGEFLKRRFPDPLDPAGVAAALVAVATGEAFPEATLLGLTGKGLHQV